MKLTKTGIDLAPVLEMRGEQQVHQCLDCHRPMQQDRRKVKGWTPIPGLARHESAGKCQACCQTRRGGYKKPARPVAVSGDRTTRSDAHAVVAWMTAGLDWARDASCGDAADADVFAMPDHYHGQIVPPDAVIAARKFCAHCPVVAECKAFADTHSTGYMPLTGLWGGEWRSTVGVTPITTKAEVRIPKTNALVGAAV